jgi:hypothetical protein
MDAGAAVDPVVVVDPAPDDVVVGAGVDPGVGVAVAVPTFDDPRPRVPPPDEWLAPDDDEAVVTVGFGHVWGVIGGGFGAPAIFCSWMNTSETRFGGKGE